MREYEMAAILFLAEFSAKDALLALDGAFENNLPFNTRAALNAGYRPAEVGQGLKAAFDQRENQIAATFRGAGSCAQDALEAIDGAFALSSKLASRTVLKAGYPEEEVMRALRNLGAEEAVDNGPRRPPAAEPRPGAPPPPRMAPTVPANDEAPVKIYLYDVPEDLLFMQRGTLTREYFEMLRDPDHRAPVAFDLSRRMLSKHYFSEAATKDWTQQYGYEFVVADQLRRSPLRTHDPEDADFFLIPHFTTAIFAKLLKNVEFLGFKSSPFIHVHFPQILKIANGYFNAILGHVRSQYPYFDRTGGRDHLLLCCWDNGIGIDEKRSVRGYNVTHMFSDLLIHELRNVIQLTYHGNRSAGYFRNHPCVTLPPFINDHLVRRIRADPRSQDFSRRQRTQLSFFLGSKAHHPMREIYERCYGGDPDMLVNTPELKSDKFDDIRLSSLFAICLEGYTPWTMRLPQALLFGCIPVIISGNIILPFERYVDWEACSLRVSPRDIPQLKSILQNLPREEVARLQRGVVRCAEELLYDSRRPLFGQRLGELIVTELHRIRSEYGLKVTVDRRHPAGRSGFRRITWAVACGFRRVSKAVNF